MARAAVLGVVLAVALAACAPRLEAPGPAIVEPAIAEGRLIAADGASTPLRAWLPEDGRPRAVLLALHGLNDYGSFFAAAGGFLARHGIAGYAYDQRGFGESANRGLWPGTQAFVDDLRAAVALVRARHPGLPVYLLGASMGASVALVAMTAPDAPAVDGVILTAPAVWGRSTMPFYQRAALWVAAHTVPWLTVTGRSLRVRASDNVEMLKALGRDPLVIKETRIDVLWGLADLMDAALTAGPRFAERTLILYGRNDEVIPADPVRRWLRSLPESARARQRIAYYDRGWHMLLRDLQAETVWRDILAWIEDSQGPLPSRADGEAAALVGGGAPGGDGAAAAAPP